MFEVIKKICIINLRHFSYLKIIQEWNVYTL